ncbi:MAG TPA: hypothetical protein VF550_13325 [Polyangia bacterium]
MLRFRSAVVVGSLVLFSLFACGDKINPRRNAPTGVGGTTGEGGSPDTGGIDGSVSEAGVGIDGAGGNTTAVVTYSKTIAPIMAASCSISGCHSGSSPSLGLSLDSYASVKLYLSQVSGAIQAGSMPIPPGAALTAADKKNFQDWVSAGAPNN